MEKINILLLRGLTREVAHWSNFPEKLKESGLVNKVVCLDLLGSGVKHKDISPLKIEDYVQDLRAEMKVHFQEGKWSVLAISMGAMIAMEWCHQFPNDFENLFVINMSAKNLASPLKRLSLGTVGFILKSLYDKSIAQREQGIKNLTTNIHMDNSIVDEWIEIANKRPVRIPNFFRQITAAAKFKVPAIVDVPTLILASENDHLAHVSNSKKLVKVLDKAHLELHNIAGHDLPLDDPEWIIEKMKDYLNQRI